MPTCLAEKEQDKVVFTKHSWSRKLCMVVMYLSILCPPPPPLQPPNRAIVSQGGDLGWGRPCNPIPSKKVGSYWDLTMQSKIIK